MPQILGHGQSLRKMGRRWHTSTLAWGSALINEMASWAQPTVQLSKEYLDDDRLIWGVTVDGEIAAAAGRYPACACFSSTKEVHFRKIEFSIVTSTGDSLPTFEVCLLTPTPVYNPVLHGEPYPAPGTPGQFYPFVYLSAPGVDYAHPQCAFIGGFALALQQVNVGGTIINPAIGPRYKQQTVNVGLVNPPRTTVILDWDDPPLILPPNRMLAVQHFNPSGSQVWLQVNFYISERDVE